jgi:uncharacterized protein (UPF0276 family)
VSALDFAAVTTRTFSNTAPRFLDRIAELYPIVMHGVALSIGSSDPLDTAYLRALKHLRSRTRARLISDHLCFTGVAGRNTHDLLPVPYTESMLRYVASRVRTVQDTLGERIALENPATYAGFRASSMPEGEFLARLAIEADCHILLDVNNVYVSAFNHGFSAHAYIDALPIERIVQLHLAGHTHFGTHIIDTHSGTVADPVWDLLAYVRQRGACAPVMLEWDADIPDFPTVHREALKAQQLVNTEAA